MSENNILKTALRLPRNLHSQLHEAASTSGRSLNAEIVARLEETFEIESFLMNRVIDDPEHLPKLKDILFFYDVLATELKEAREQNVHADLPDEIKAIIATFSKELVENINKE